MKKIIIILSAVILSSCGVRKQYSSPDITTDGIFGIEYGSGDTTTIADIEWNKMFSDRYLQELIGLALDNNSDLNMARLRIQQAESSLKSAKLGYYPSFNFVPEGSLGSFDNSKTSKVYSIPVAASWEIDIFGRIDNAKKRTQAAYEQSLEYTQAVQSSIVATVANMYYTLLMLDKQYELSVKTAESWKTTIEVMRRMMDAGMFNLAGIAQSEAYYYSVEASLFDLRESINQIENALSVLLFRIPGKIERSSLDEQAFPEELSYGVPVQLLSKRPDVRSAELDLIQAHYSTNEARANLYPSLRLSGSAGWTNSTGSFIVNPGKLLLAAAASLTQPIFNQRLNRTQLEIMQAQQEIAALQFQQTVLNAGAEVNDALTQIQTSREKMAYIDKQIASLETAVEATQLLMTHSSTSYLEILAAQQSLLGAQLGQIAEKFTEIQGIINLYHALGGGTDTEYKFR
ncbi:MAG: TolC family protein [Rikenellaceae bacterium]|nr:TolC family protein [Rikenellaceae bacterium]